MPSTRLIASVFVALCFVACSPNEAATKKCKSKGASSDACSACCTENGANGYKYVNGACSCLGGS